MGIKDGGKRPEPDHMNSGNSKSLIYYMVITMVITLLLNGLVFPSMMRQEILEVGYNDFLAMVDAGQVRQVQRKSFAFWQRMPMGRNSSIRPGCGRTQSSRNVFMRPV